MFELEGVSEALAKRAMELASRKLSVPVKFVSREGGELKA